MVEIWKDIPGFEGFYQVSNFGKIRSKWRNRHYSVSYSYRIIKGCYSNTTGYITVSLRNLNGDKRQETVHRLVAESFLHKESGKEYIDHIDTNRTNNAVSNLRWVTAKENSNNPLTLKKCSIASIKKAKRGGANGNAVAVYVYDLNKKLLSTFSSAIEAATYFNVKYSRVLHNINKEQNHVNGYIFSKNKL